MQQQQQQQQRRRRSRSRRRSATKLPNDILQNILSRLPVKTLTRFKSVSKSINSLLHDPHFIKLHLLRMSQTAQNRVFVSTDPPQIIIPPNQQQNDLNIVPVQYPSLIPANDVNIIGSCNGLLCFMVDDSFTEESVIYRFVLWNPSTRICRDLPNPPPLLGNYPDVIPIYGFGYDSSTDDYKVIRAVSPYDGVKSTDLEVYSLKGDVWKMKKQASLPCVLTAEYWRKIEPDFPGIFSRGAGVFTNGAIHWLEKRNGIDIILSFNLSTEEFEEAVSLPDYNQEDYRLTELRVLKQKLSILVHKWQTSEIEIWVMEEYGLKSSWMKIVTMAANPGAEFVDSFMDDWFVPFFYCGNGCLLVDMDGSEVLLYDPRVKTFSRVELGNDRQLFLVQEFVESLVAPYAG